MMKKCSYLTPPPDPKVTMLLRISRGRNGRIETPFMILTNKDFNYPVRGVPENIPVVAGAL